MLQSDEDPYILSQADAWSKHTNGAVALLMSRGPDQLNTARGLQLFRLAHTTALIDMMLKQQAPPEQLLSIIETSLQAPQQERKNELFISMQMHRLVAMIVAGAGPLAEMMRAQKVFEQEIIDEEYWQPRKASLLKEDQHRWPGQCYFCSGFVMSNWLTHWTTSLLLHQISLDHVLQHGFHDASTSDQHQFLAEVEANANHILQSVSFAFDEIDSLGTQKHRASRERNGWAGSAVGSIHLLWPLGVIIACPYVGDVQRVFAQEALRYIARVFGVNRALRYV
jgi:hypothetical protein